MISKFCHHQEQNGEGRWKCHAQNEVALLGAEGTICEGQRQRPGAVVTARLGESPSLVLNIDETYLD